MERLETTRAENAGSSNKKPQAQYSDNSANSQRQRILEWLQHSSMTTLEARQYLDVLHPGARILELRARGYNIVTEWVYDATASGNRHRVANYILLAAL
jgi:hypothetical protein